jgi:hypothetical protein
MLFKNKTWKRHMIFFNIFSLVLLFILVAIPTFKLARYWLLDEDFKEEIVNGEFTFKNLEALAFSIACGILAASVAKIIFQIELNPTLIQIVSYLFYCCLFSVLRTIGMIILDKFIYK